MEQRSVKFESKYNYFHSQKLIQNVVCKMAAILSLFHYDINGLVQDCSIFSVLPMEILQSYTKASIYAI